LYIDQLSSYIAERRVTVEVCLTSNLQTNPNLHDIKDHSLRQMLERNISVTFCTDNRLVSNTTVSREIKLAVDNFPIPPKTFKDCIIYGFKRSFFPGDYSHKRRYVRQIINHYEKIAQKYQIAF
ncbi:MAG: adenosine deaminase family protein, partial [Pseudomonadota bacterium]